MKSKFWWNVGLVVALGSPVLFLAGKPAAAANKAEPQVVASIVSPKPDEAVSRSHEVVGKSAIAGQPVVLVRPDSIGGEWYVQAPVVMTARGIFKSKVCFGSDQTLPGAKFQVAVIVLRTQEEIDFLKGKEFLLELPDTLAQSEAVSVVLAKEEEEVVAKAKLAGTILNPAPDAKVKCLHEVTGKLTTKGWPVVLVRSDEANEDWWVQGVPRLNSKGAFTATAQFGNEKTPSGKKFRLTFLTLPSAKEAAAFKVGASLAKLPTDIPHSEPVTVILNRPGAPPAPAAAVAEVAEVAEVEIAADDEVKADEVAKE